MYCATGGSAPASARWPACRSPTGRFLFIFTLHLEAGLGASAPRAGLTFIPLSATFGLLAFYWRKLPAGVHHLLAPVGMALTVLGYLGVAAGMRSGAQSGTLMWISLTVIGAGLGLAAAPVLTQSLVHVPMSQAADASGVLTTTVQLSQLIGVAIFGTMFLSLDKSSTLEHAAASSHALSGTGLWIALLSLIGVGAGLALSRNVLWARLRQKV